MSEAMQLKDKIKNLALKNHVPAQEVLQNFMLERLLQLWVVYPGADVYQVEKKISVLPQQKVPELIHQF